MPTITTATGAEEKKRGARGVDVREAWPYLGWVAASRGRQHLRGEVAAEQEKGVCGEGAPGGGDRMDKGAGREGARTRGS